MTVEGNVSRQKPHHSSTDSDHKIVAGTRPVFFFCGFGLPPDCTSYRKMQVKHKLSELRTATMVAFSLP